MSGCFLIPFRRLLLGKAGLLLSVVAASLAASALAEDWPAWRGADGTGVTADKALPLEWSEEENVIWKIDLPDRGNSTPIVIDDVVILTQAITETNRRTVMVLDAKDGSLRWQRGVTYSEEEASHRDNPYCASSPVSDGERIVAWFGSAGLYCYDFQGERLWSRDLGKQAHMWGNAASPVLYKDLCILSFGPGERETLIAVDKNTGDTVWEVEGLSEEEEAKLIEPGTDGNATDRRSEEQKAAGPASRVDLQRGAWGTPLLVRANGQDELVVSYPRRLVGYDPSNGKELWTCRGLGPLVYSSPIAGENTVVILGGYYGASMAVRPGGRGDVTETHRVWHTPRSAKTWLSSGIIFNGHIYLLDMGGIAHCLDRETGQTVWSKRLQGDSGDNASWSSLVRAGDRIYASNRSGDAFVFRADPEFELLASSSVKQRSDSSLVPADGRFYFRTHEGLWCLGQQEP